MPTWMAISISFALAYLVGAVPFALIVGRVAFHVDVREHGSGNLGATNVVRVLGWRAGLGVAVLDIGKGALAVLVARILAPDGLSADGVDWLLIGTALFAVLGHSYSPYIGFKGGKGVATAAGALLQITPLAWAIMLLTFLAVVSLSRLVSLGSIIIATMFPVLCLVFYSDRTPIVIMSFVTAAVVLWRHRSNMKRILDGNESKIGRGGSAIRGTAGGTTTEEGEA